MDKYYSSKLAKQIESGENGIENLDYKNLAEDLIENELSDWFNLKKNSGMNKQFCGITESFSMNIGLYSKSSRFL